MENPWLNISPGDYENHMMEIGQSQVLNDLLKESLRKYKPNSFALVGCSTGNGLEHVDCQITKVTHAIDIVPEYLTITWKRFNSRIDDLIIHNIDLNEEELSISNIDLFFVGLVLEYVDVEKALSSIIQSMNKTGSLVIVIQQTKDTTFVTHTKYQSLENVSNISHEVNESDLNTTMVINNMKLINREVIELTIDKCFVLLEYQNNT